jgi:phosphoglycerol transferase MdoB-like AlkP superfamily enzyme
MQFKKLYQHRFGPVFVVTTIIVLLSFVLRCTLLAMAFNNVAGNFLHYFGIFFIGFFYDCVVSTFFALPIALYCWLVPQNLYKSKVGKAILYVLFGIIIFILVFSAIGEVTFWLEYGKRYDFIAVDYLVYTNEVIVNIIESYNMVLVVGVLLLATGTILFFATKLLQRVQHSTIGFAKRTGYFFLCVAFAAVSYFGVKNKYRKISTNKYINELAGNGIYEFGHAFWHNEIDYYEYYETLPNAESVALLRSNLQNKNTQFLNNGNDDIYRKIIADTAALPYNVVFISVESLSGAFLTRFGSKWGITPYLDSLMQHSLFFDNFYAAGTRTVRGLEALSMAITPTPGQSIVRRPNNANLCTIGGILNQKNYDVRYIYGGNAFFDNMGAYFGANHYTVHDKSAIPDSLIKHTTAWGADDEASFNYTLQQCDKSYAAGKLFFNHIMTVSNHRPYTYPEGKIDIPPSRKIWEGAVKYTDYAINDFLKKAQQKPWFNQTIFVIVADHCSASAGKTDLPVNNYHIPCFIYAPKLIAPRIENRFVSQIDLAPTLLGFLNQSYTSSFMGSDIYKRDSTQDRLFISTYQNLGYIKNDTLVQLDPQKRVNFYTVNFKTGVATLIKNGPQQLKNQAIAWYQTAFYLYKNNKYGLK